MLICVIWHTLHISESFFLFFTPHITNKTGLSFQDDSVWTPCPCLADISTQGGFRGSFLYKENTEYSWLAQLL